MHPSSRSTRWPQLALAALLTTPLLLTACSSDDDNSPTPTPTPTDKQWRTSVAYEIFVRSFHDSDGDGGGDLNGVTSRLDYLQQLGVDALWLMPIHPTPTHHGYAVSDYLTINPDYGTLADFTALLDGAHSRDMRVIMDLVVNHTSEQHLWFQGMLAGDANYANFYRCGDSAIDGNWGEVAPGLFCYYSFGPQSGLPDLNYDEPAVRQAIKEVAAFWIGQGVDGFRLDVAQDIGDGDDRYSVAWWREFDSYIRSLNPALFVIGEVNYDSSDANTQIAPFLQGMDATFDFPLYNETVVTAAGLTKDILAGLNPARAEYAAYNPNFVDATVIGNHDRSRIASELNFADDKIRKAVALQMTLPGTPFIYYGDEIGMRGGHDLQGDPHKREPLDWYASGNGPGMAVMTKAVYGAEAKNIIANDGISVEEQENDDHSLLAYYRQLIALRKANDILFDGDYVRVGTPAGTYGYLVSRDDADYRLLVVHNQDLEQSAVLEISAASEELLSGSQLQAGDSFTIAPYATAIIKADKELLPVAIGPITNDTLDTSDVTLTITVHVPDNTPDDAPLYMPNSDDGWDPTTITVDPDTTLTQIDENSYSITVTRPRGTRLEYKFFRGGWDSSETDVEGNWTGNRTFLFVDDHSEVEVNIQGWRDTNYHGD